MEKQETRPRWQVPLDPFGMGYRDGQAGFDRDIRDSWTPEEVALYESGYHDGVFDW
jgi:hypothetical protein